MKTLYTASAITHGGRAGKVESSDGVLELDLSVPKEMGGDGGTGTNPEQLFAAGYAACFESALRLVAGNQEKDLGDASIRANVGLGRDSDGNFGLAVGLVGRMPNLPREEAEALMAEAHQVCPYSRATRCNVDVELTVED
jgi:Ohr subfamily peroxiredoxin